MPSVALIDSSYEDNSLGRLQKEFKGVIATPDSNSDDYKIERWSMQTIRRASYVVFPLDADDISKAILFAEAKKLPLAIAGGRHNNDGASSSEGGLVIDMRRMRAVRVDKESMVAYFAGGTIVSDVDHELIKHGVATVTGLVESEAAGVLASAPVTTVGSGPADMINQKERAGTAVVFCWLAVVVGELTLRAVIGVAVLES